MRIWWNREERNLKELSESSHDLKVESEKIGLPRLQASCENMINYCNRNETFKRLDDLLKQLNHEYKEAKDFLEMLLKNKGY